MPPSQPGGPGRTCLEAIEIEPKASEMEALGAAAVVRASNSSLLSFVVFSAVSASDKRVDYLLKCDVLKIGKMQKVLRN